MPNDTPESLAAIIQSARNRADNYRHDGWESVAEELEDLVDRIDAATARERDTRRKQDRRHYSEIIARLEDKLAESVRKNELLRAENIQLANDVEKENRKIERLSGNIASELKSALVEILDRTNREKARDYDAALNGGMLEIHDIANTALDQTKGE